MWTHRGKVCKLRGPPLRAGLSLREKKAARSEAEGWRSPSPKWWQPAQAAQPEEPPAGASGEGGGDMEVEEIRHESSSGEDMEE